MDRQNRDREGARLLGEEQIERGRETEQAKLADIQSQSNQRNAIAASKLAPEPHIFPGPDGYHYLYDKTTNTASLIPGQGEKPKTPKNLQIVTRKNADGSEDVGYADPETKTFFPLKDEKGQPVTNAAKPLVQRKLSDGTVVSVSPDTAAHLDAELTGRDATAKREAENQARIESRRADEDALRYAEDAQRRTREAAAIAARFELNKNKYFSALNSDDEQEQAKAQSYKDAAQAAKDELSSYGDVYETGTGEGGVAYAKPKQQVSVSEAVSKQPGKSRSQVLREIRDKGFVPIP